MVISSTVFSFEFFNSKKVLEARFWWPLNRVFERLLVNLGFGRRVGRSWRTSGKRSTCWLLMNSQSPSEARTMNSSWPVRLQTQISSGKQSTWLPTDSELFDHLVSQGPRHRQSCLFLSTPHSQGPLRPSLLVVLVVDHPLQRLNPFLFLTTLRFVVLRQRHHSTLHFQYHPRITRVRHYYLLKLISTFSSFKSTFTVKAVLPDI